MNIRATATFTARSSIGQFIAAKITPGVLRATEDMANVVLLEAQAIVPVDTGELQASGRSSVRETGHGAVGDVEFTADHAAYVEYGTGIRGQESPGAGPYPYNPNWAGMPAQPYLRPALEIARREAVGEYALRIREGLGV